MLSTTSVLEAEKVPGFFFTDYQEVESVVHCGMR